MAELDKVLYFLDGLKPATRMEVSYKAPETFDEAWKLAVQYDTAMDGTGRPTGKDKAYSRTYEYKYSGRDRSGPTPMELN